MKKLFLRLAAILIAAVVITMALSHVYMKSLETYALDASGMPDVIRVANVGNSHGLHAFDYSQVDGGFNFALGAQPPQYDLSILRRYIVRFAEGATLFIPISYTSLWGDPTEDSQYEALTMRYMGLLDADGLVLKSRTDYWILKYFSVLRYADSQTHSIFDPKSDRMITTSDSGLSLEEIGWRRAVYHSALAYQDGALIPMHEPSVNAVREMVALCREHGVNPILITTPYTTAYASSCPAELLETFYAEVHALSEELGVPYADYSQDERFTDAALFEDSDHLNEQGAALFTQMMLETWIG